MFKTRIRFDGKKVTIKAFGVRPLQMLQLGRAGLAHVKQRVSQGVGLEDSPMKPLKSFRSIRRKDGKLVMIGRDRGYPGLKRRKGKRDIRDLNFTGAMLDNLSVRNATENEVRIGFTTKLARQKALANQRRDPWLGWSDSDSKVIADKAQQVFKNSVQQYFKEAKRQFRRAA